MPFSLPQIFSQQKTGNEALTFEDENTDLKLIDFWKWSVSDIISNATRGIFAEFIVATALKIDLSAVREEWGAFDLTSPEGIKVEVKASAYIQSWEQYKLSSIQFSTKATLPWDYTIDKRSSVAVRLSDVYVFSLLHHSDQSTIDPMKLEQWEFYVLPTSIVTNRNKNSISLKTLQSLTMAVKYDKLREAILNI